MNYLTSAQKAEDERIATLAKQHEAQRAADRTPSEVEADEAAKHHVSDYREADVMVGTWQAYCLDCGDLGEEQNFADDAHDIAAAHMDTVKRLTEQASRYINEAESLVDGFSYELCSECEQDLHAHTIAPDALGHAHVYCQTVTA